MKKRMQTGKAYQVFGQNTDGLFWIGESETLKGARIIATRHGWYDDFNDFRKPNIYRLDCLVYDMNHYDVLNRHCPYYPSTMPYRLSIPVDAEEYILF